MPKILGRLDGSYQASDKLEDRFYVKKFSDTYIVLADTPAQTEEDILATTGIPARGAFSRGAYCKGRSAEEVETIIHPTTDVVTVLWHVKVEFDSSVNAQDASQTGGGGGGSDPESLRPERRVYCEKLPALLVRDAQTGEPIINANGEPFELEYNLTVVCLEISRYETDFDIQHILDYVETLNQDVFYGFPPGTCYMDSITEDEEDVDGELSFHRTYLIKILVRKPPNNNANLMKIEDAKGVVVGNLTLDANGVEHDSWTIHQLHHGTKYRKGDLEEPVVMIKNGQPVTVNLLPTGELLPDGAAPWYVVFNRCRKTIWAGLNLEF